MRKKHILSILVMISCLGAGPFALAGKGAYPGANGVPFQELQGQITNLDTYINEELAAVWIRIGELQTSIDANSARDDAQDAIIGLLAGALAQLESRVSLNEADIDALEAMDLVLLGLIDALEGRVDGLQSQINIQGDQISLLVLEDQTLQQLIDALASRVETLEGLMSTVNADIEPLEAEVSNLKQRMSNAETAIASKQNRIWNYCGTGSSIRQINANGSVVCETDSIATGGFTSFTVQAISVSGDANAASGFASTSKTATCPSGSKRTGGGFYVQSDVMFVNGSFPSGSNSWETVVRGSWPVSFWFKSYIVCLTLN